MAKALGPAYLRFAGPYSLAYFGDKNSQDKEDNRKTILSGELNRHLFNPFSLFK